MGDTVNDYMIKAAELMAKVEAMDNPTLPVAKAWTEMAKVYATLATAQATACGMCPLGGQLAANHLAQVSAEHAPVHTLKPRGERL